MSSNVVTLKCKHTLDCELYLQKICLYSDCWRHGKINLCCCKNLLCCIPYIALFFCLIIVKIHHAKLFYVYYKSTSTYKGSDAEEPEVSSFWWHFKSFFLLKCQNLHAHSSTCQWIKCLMLKANIAWSLSVKMTRGRLLCKFTPLHHNILKRKIYHSKNLNKMYRKISIIASREAKAKLMWWLWSEITTAFIWVCVCFCFCFCYH